MAGEYVFVHQDFFARKSYRRRWAKLAGLEADEFEEYVDDVASAELVNTKDGWCVVIDTLPNGNKLYAYRGTLVHDVSDDNLDILQLTLSAVCGSPCAPRARAEVRSQLGPRSWLYESANRLGSFIAEYHGEASNPVAERVEQNYSSAATRVVVSVLKTVD